MLAANETNELNIIASQVFDEMPDELSVESAYGLEYIIDEIFSENKLQNLNYERSIDWFGLHDMRN